MLAQSAIIINTRVLIAELSLKNVVFFFRKSELCVKAGHNWDWEDVHKMFIATFRQTRYGPLFLISGKNINHIMKRRNVGYIRM